MRFFMLAIAFLVAFSELAGLEERSFSSPMTTSVIIPCHYMHFYLIQDLLTQFERQTAVPDEVVISLARSHYEKLDQAAIAAICGRSWAFTLKVVLAEDAVSSPGKNRNRACECSSGDLLICQDADDIPHPQRIEIIKHLFEHYRVEFLIHCFAPSAADIGFMKSYDLHEMASLSSYFGINPKVSKNLCNGYVALVRDVFETIRWPQLHTGEDVGFNFSVYFNPRFKYKVALDIPLVIYRKDLSTYHPANF